jgi:hypothetical protein
VRFVPGSVLFRCELVPEYCSVSRLEVVGDDIHFQIHTNTNTNAMVEAMRTRCLTDGWTFKQADDTSKDAWLPVKRVPTNIHLDLIANGRYVITWRRILIYLIYASTH